MNEKDYHYIIYRNINISIHDTIANWDYYVCRSQLSESHFLALTVISYIGIIGLIVLSNSCSNFSRTWGNALTFILVGPLTLLLIIIFAFTLEKILVLQIGKEYITSIILLLSITTLNLLYITKNIRKKNQSNLTVKSSGIPRTKKGSIKAYVLTITICFEIALIEYYNINDFINHHDALGIPLLTVVLSAFWIALANNHKLYVSRLGNTSVILLSVAAIGYAIYAGHNNVSFSEIPWRIVQYALALLNPIIIMLFSTHYLRKQKQKENSKLI